MMWQAIQSVINSFFSTGFFDFLKFQVKGTNTENYILAFVSSVCND